MAIAFLSNSQKSIYDVETLMIDENAFDSVVKFDYVEPYLNGISWLRQHVKENLEAYPMEEKAILSSRDKDHEAHKRWERYMRTLPVKVLKVSDLNSALSLECISLDTISVCEDFTDTWLLNFQNNSEQPLSFEFELGANSFIVFPNSKEDVKISSNTNPLSSEQVHYIGNGRATIFMPAKTNLKIELPVVYSCDGRDGDTYRSAFPNDTLAIEYKVKLTGYIYNQNERELYLIATLFENLKNIQLNF